MARPLGRPKAQWLGALNLICGFGTTSNKNKGFLTAKQLRG
jgi:hypothetical protein